jgi:histone acetyltransferase 1
MLIQLHLNPADARAAKAYRLQVKERLYRFNYVSASIHSIVCMLFCEGMG